MRRTGDRAATSSDRSCARRAAEHVVVPSTELRALERWLDDRLFGLGELAPLLRDDRVGEVMVNGTRGVWVERDGG